MKRARTAYELSQSQVSTPDAVVRQFWHLVHQRRPTLQRVLDVGAGDCRFAKGSRVAEYVGVEIDPVRASKAKLPKNGRLILNCAFAHRAKNYDACIGNPPYVRHHDLESPWRDEVAKRIENALGIRLNKKSNLFLYFLCLALLKTSEHGLIALVVPFEWVSRPSAAPVRDYLRHKGWKVDIYRYTDNIFENVLTTACISIIDKGESTPKWSYSTLSTKNLPKNRIGSTAELDDVLPYVGRGKTWAMRGMSPGSQKIFCLTEGERIHHGLSRRDVIPCVTTLRPLPRDASSLTNGNFKKHFVDTGERCWLIKSHSQVLSARVRAYVSSIPKTSRDNFTCNQRSPWYRFPLHPVPKLLVASGFVNFGPKVVRNPIGAHAIGAVTGIHFDVLKGIRKIQQGLLQMNFESQVVAHAKTLRKVEIGQLNAALKTLAGRT